MKGGTNLWQDLISLYSLWPYSWNFVKEIWGIYAFEIIKNLNQIHSTFQKILLLSNSNNKMTLWYIESYYSNLIRKDSWKELAIVFYYEQSDRTYLLRYSQTYFDYLWHVFKLPDMFLMSRIPRIIFSYRINFSLV